VLKSSIAQAVVVTGLSFCVPACSFAAAEVGLSPKKAVPSISADLKGKWCFDDGARVSVQRSINISLPQRLPAQEFDDEAGIRHMTWNRCPCRGCTRATCLATCSPASPTVTS